MSTVCFRVGGREFSVERHAAAIFATNLDKLSAGTLGDSGRAGAPSLLEKVDDVVVGTPTTRSSSKATRPRRSSTS